MVFQTEWLLFELLTKMPVYYYFSSYKTHILMTMMRTMKLCIGSNHILEYRHIWRWKKMSITICRPVRSSLYIQSKLPTRQRRPNHLRFNKGTYCQIESKTRYTTTVEVNVVRKVKIMVRKKDHILFRTQLLRETMIIYIITETTVTTQNLRRADLSRCLINRVSQNIGK